MGPRERVVVAGGIGSGKSRVIAVLRELGWSAIDADGVGHKVLSDPGVVEAVAARWPKALENGEVNRARLADIVFNDAEELTALEGITHPRIIEQIDEWIQRAPIPAAVEVSVVRVARPEWGPLAIVHAPLTVRMERAVGRGLARADVEARMAVQPPDTELLAMADVVVDNQGTLDQLREDATRLAGWLRE